MTEDMKFFFNGIDGETGEYLVPPKCADELAALAKTAPRDSVVERSLAASWRTATAPTFGLPFNVQPENVGKAGWAVVFHEKEHQHVKDALLPLVEHRRQASDAGLVKVLEYRNGEGWAQWLARNGTAPGIVDPKKVPYYLLFIGGPTKIPFWFIHLLDVEYAVGCLHFDEPADYSRYVDSVIDYETSDSVQSGKEAVFFAPRHPYDKATQYSADFLAKPLVQGLFSADGQQVEPAIADQVGFRSRAFLGATATKAALMDAFAAPIGKCSPAFIFTASHGLGYPYLHPEQRSRHGALICQDWPGRGLGPIAPEHYFAASDLLPEARVHGMINFHFACYSMGTPSYDRFFHESGKAPPRIADEDFIANLPKKLLSHPNGGALACIGHVDRTFVSSFVPSGAGSQLQPFRNTIGRILSGQPVGHALKDFNERYAALSTSLAYLLEEIEFGVNVSEQRIATDWVERNDAEGYLLVGDPAVRLRVKEMS
jgi:hypothetical protein